MASVEGSKVQYLLNVQPLGQGALLTWPLSTLGIHRPLQTPDLSGFYSLTSGSMGQLPHTVSW